MKSEQSFQDNYYKGVILKDTELGNDDSLPAPQLVTGAWMLYVMFKKDPDLIKRFLPPGLEPHPNNSILLNMYTVPDEFQTTGFGPYTLTYLVAQVKGHDGYLVGQEEREPGRYWFGYYNSSETMAGFTKKAGIPAEPGITTLNNKNGNLQAALEINGETVIEATAQVGEGFESRICGQANYFGLRKIKKNNSERLQIMKYPIPYIVEVVKTENATAAFNMPADHPLSCLGYINVEWAAYVRGSFVYPQAQILKEVGIE